MLDNIMFCRGLPTWCLLPIYLSVTYFPVYPSALTFLHVAQAFVQRGNFNCLLSLNPAFQESTCLCLAKAGEG